MDDLAAKPHTAVLTRKRKRNDKNKLPNVRKKLRNKGEQYTTSTGSKIPKRSIKLVNVTTSAITIFLILKGKQCTQTIGPVVYMKNKQLTVYS